jgi:hypothetical protein
VTARAAALKSAVRVGGGIEGGGEGLVFPRGRLFCNDDKSIFAIGEADSCVDDGALYCS